MQAFSQFFFKKNEPKRVTQINITRLGIHGRCQTMKSYVFLVNYLKNSGFS